MPASGGGRFRSRPPCRRKELQLSGDTPVGAEEEAFGRRSAFGSPKAFDRFPEDRLEGESTELLSEAGLGWVLKSK